MKASVLDDYTDIAKRQKILAAYQRGECVIRAGGSSQNCWCWMAGPNNAHLPCPPPAKEN